MADFSTPPPLLHRVAPRLALMLVALLGLVLVQRPDGRLHVFFPALAGDAVLIQTPRGSFVLIDGGSDPDALVAALGRRMPFWQRDLDLVIVTVADAQRLPGQVAALERYTPHHALVPPDADSGAVVDAWRQRLVMARSSLQRLHPGQRVELDGATLRVLDVSAGGVLLCLDYGSTSVVFAHAAAPAMLQRPVGRHATLLVYPWQRDAHVPLVESLRPAVIVFSDGERVAQPVLQTYHERAIGGARLYHEDLDGDIEWISDGRRTWMHTGS